VSIFLSTLPAVVAIWLAVACMARLERRAESARRFHRAQLRAHRRELADRLDALDADATARVEGRLTPSRCAPHGARCTHPVRPVRQPDGRPDDVRRAVWRAIAAHPRALGMIVFITDPRAAWRPMEVARPGRPPRPALFVTPWGWS